MSALTLVHIAGGSVALLAGAAALSLRKGGRLHAKAGTMFFASMLVLTVTGSVIAAFKPERGTVIIGILTCYLVATSWMTARRRDGKAGRFELVALAVALGCAVAMFSFGMQAANSPTGRLDSLPPAAHFPFAALAAIAALLDLNFILRGGVSGVQRIARHLWRMCAALFIASASFFLGQQDEFPLALQGLFVWFLPPLAAMLAMIFWLIRVRFSKAFRHVAPMRVTPAGDSSAQDRARATA